MVALLVGLGLAAWAVAVPGPVRYVAGCVLVGLAVSGLTHAALRRQGRPRARAVSLGIGVTLVAAAVGGPLLLATSGSEGTWATDIDRRPVGILATSDALVLADRSGLVTLDPRTGEHLGEIDTDRELIGVQDAGAGLFVVSTWQQVSLHGADGTTRWAVDRGGDRWEADRGGDPDPFWVAVAAQDGVVVLAAAATDDRTAAVRALSPAGEELWRTDGVAFGPVDVRTGQTGSIVSDLPQVALVRQGEEPVTSVDVPTGETLGRPSADLSPVAVDDATVLWTRRARETAEPGSDCEGTSTEGGRALWTAEIPCLAVAGAFPVSTVHDGRVVYHSTSQPGTDPPPATRPDPESAELSTVVSIDLSSGDVAAVPASPLDSEYGRPWEHSVGREVVVVHGPSPHASVEAWQHGARRPAWVHDSGSRGAPGTRIGHGVVALLDDHVVRNPIGLPTDPHLEHVTVLDAATGDTIGGFGPAAVDHWGLVAPGQVVVVTAETPDADGEERWRAHLVDTSR